MEFLLKVKNNYLIKILNLNFLKVVLKAKNKVVFLKLKN